MVVILDEELKEEIKGEVDKKMNETIESPVKIGDILKLGVVKFGKEGDPIMIHKKLIIFLKDKEKRGIELNTMIEVKITKVLPHFAFAERTNGT